MLERLPRLGLLPWGGDTGLGQIRISSWNGGRESSQADHEGKAQYPCQRCHHQRSPVPAPGSCEEVCIWCIDGAQPEALKRIGHHTAHWFWKPVIIFLLRAQILLEISRSPRPSWLRQWKTTPTENHADGWGLPRTRCCFHLFFFKKLKDAIPSLPIKHERIFSSEGIPRSFSTPLPSLASHYLRPVRFQGQIRTDTLLHCVQGQCWHEQRVSNKKVYEEG